MKLTFSKLQEIEYLLKEFSTFPKRFNLNFEVPKYQMVISTTLGVLSGDFLDYDFDGCAKIFSSDRTQLKDTYISDIPHLKNLKSELKNRVGLNGSITFSKEYISTLSNSPEILLPFLSNIVLNNHEKTENIYPIVKNVNLSGETYPFLLLDDTEFSLIGLIEA
ncbi:MAG: hypothetical protein ACOYEB_03700 [Enterococcus lemanii]|jgi:hypothetical protein